MDIIRKVGRDLFWLGASDRRLAKFENDYPVPRGVSYNSFLITDERTVLIDTVDFAVARQFFENLTAALSGRTLDYIIVSHVEPDHAALISEVTARYPDVKIVGNVQTVRLLKQFIAADLTPHTFLVKEGDSLCTGRHTFSFYMAPMVHWPEVMMTYDGSEGILYSADAFGSFGALSGSLFADEVNFDRDWLPEMRRYYANIVGKYGVQVQTALKKLSGLTIDRIYPLHGLLWRSGLDYLLEKHRLWSTYQAEERAVLIAYASIYGGTENAAEVLAHALSERGVTNIAVYDLSASDVSYLVAEAFRCHCLVLAGASYNGGVFPAMEDFLVRLKEHNFQNRTVALIENGTWAPSAGKRMASHLEGMKNIRLLEGCITVYSTVSEDNRTALLAIAEQIAALCTD